MKTVAFVPIRLNSSRVAGKNLRPLGGRPLMTYILQTLLQVHNIDATYVYCSDTSIAPLLPAGVTLLQRDTSLDSDTTLGEQIYDAFTREVQADIYVLAHATSPFIRPATIEEAVARVQSGECDSAFSAERIQTFAWYGGRPLNYSLTHVPRTQELEPVYAETSAFFVFGATYGANITAVSVSVHTLPSPTVSRAPTSTTPTTSLWPKPSSRQDLTNRQEPPKHFVSGVLLFCSADIKAPFGPAATPDGCTSKARRGALAAAGR